MGFIVMVLCFNDPRLSVCMRRLSVMGSRRFCLTGGLARSLGRCGLRCLSFRRMQRRPAVHIWLGFRLGWSVLCMLAMPSVLTLRLSVS